MKIKTKLALLFASITTVILTVFASVLYISATQNRESEFYQALKKEAITKVQLFLQAQIDTLTLQKIYRNNRSTLNEVEVAIYNDKHFLLYHDAVDIDAVKETPAMLRAIYDKKQLQFYQNQWQIVGFRYAFAGKEYIITATAIDQKGYAELFNLRNTIFVLILLSILLSYAIGFVFSDRMLQPIRNITTKANDITSTNLYLRIESSKSKDEIAELANTFNAMLNRLEASFEAQKHFVSNISHELRTPLSALIAELELCIAKERSIAEYQTTLAYTLQDAQKMVKLSNSLLDFAKASYDASEIAFKEVRLDELLLDAQEQVLKQNPTYQVSITFESEILDEIVYGNEYLLRIAFSNLIENACKFSPDNCCKVAIFYQPNRTVITFLNNGLGIKEEELPHIFEPFYRGKNYQHIEGNGIGLAMTQKIIALHKGKIEVQSAKGTSTSFALSIPTQSLF